MSDAPTPPALAPPTLDEIRRARSILEGVARHTPTVPLHEYGDEGSDARDTTASGPASPGARRDIRLKLETHQPITSFKIRGIYHAAARIDPAARARGLSTVSAGNTAQALAWSARALGTTARSLMPDTAPATKIDAVRRYGGEPVLVSVDELFRFLRERGWLDEPYAFVHPWIERDVMVGHGTLGLEIVEDVPDVSTVYVPVGGGGLLGGVGSAIRAVAPDVEIVAVEPEGCAAFAASVRAGRATAAPCSTMCDGVAVPYVTDEVYPILASVCDRTMTVSEDAVVGAMRRLALGNRVVAEPSGALALAAALADDDAVEGPAVAIVTGGSIDADKLAAILTAGTGKNSGR